MVILLITGCDWPVDVNNKWVVVADHPRKARIISALLHLLQLDFDVYASRQVQLHQSINRFVCRINDIHQAQMGANLQLITRSLVYVW
jgi:hypothetical protein